MFMVWLCRKLSSTVGSGVQFTSLMIIKIPINDIRVVKSIQNCELISEMLIWEKFGRNFTVQCWVAVQQGELGWISLISDFSVLPYKIIMACA